ncbi:hypothetical protein CP533_3393 [Ophiocordyceps camponoti-saundersi (nom. inval.)]|nr:hypothetical protein CP533_3393 [Ophiocordyceps camponoti-saundersi (nom. inval.)]
MVHRHPPSLALRNRNPRAKASQQIERYHFVKDAKLALASALLKRLAISRLANVSWTTSSLWTRQPQTGKPIFDLQRGSEGGGVKVNFNVSHQAGVVVLIASSSSVQEEDEETAVDVGIDVVCPAERRTRDVNSIASEGWSRYVAVHEDVFAPEEAAALRRRSGDDVDDRLAHFYTLWCLREAYIKMTGDALLAPWLRELEMRHFAPPRASNQHQHREEVGNDDDGTALEIWFRRRRVENVCMRISTLLDDEYMVCSAVRCPPSLWASVESQLALPFTHLVLDEMVAEAEEAGRRHQ